ncbi:5077_t:CDS:2 [Ambispora leptoticha]|uniref:5077_t:CDS:1 n=1 Tax=Ambispora leptoticha TaxID=144679 RepID=A0A9N8V232_9GLOM|nr:5077_t:CDS:2 [Ambispora leptoticha]
MTSGYHAGRLSRTVASMRDLNSSDFTASTKANLRPDYLVWYRSVLIIRARLSTDSCHIFLAMLQQLNLYNSLLFIPENEHGTSKTTIQSTPISSCLPFNNTVGKYKVLSCIINMVRIIGALEPLFPLQPIRIGHIEYRNYGNNCFGKLQFFDTYVMKSIGNFRAYKFTTKDVLNKVYSKTKYTGGIIHAQEAPKFERDRYKVVLESLGLSVKPTTELIWSILVKREENQVSFFNGGHQK